MFAAKTLRISLAALTLAAVTVPAGAQEVSCAPAADATVLTADGDAQSFAPSSSMAVGHDVLVEVDPSSTYSEESVVSFTYQLDVSTPQDVTAPRDADVVLDLDWDDDVSDFDMYILDEEGDRIAEGASNTLFNEYVDGGTGEQARLDNLDQCSVFTVEIVNYSGSPLATLDLDLRVSGIK